MITESIRFTTDEIQLINSKKACTSFSSNSWSDDDISILRNKIKSFYIDKQNNQCPYCKQRFSSNNHRIWDVEHIIPRKLAKNFMFEPKNLCVSCIDCNKEKTDQKVTKSVAQNRLPKRSDQYLIVHPHFDNYEDNILVVKVGVYYITLKEKGRKTIEVCGLNRFYQFSSYDPAVQNDERIRMLSNRLCEDNISVPEKVALRNEISSICMIINSK